MDGVSILPVNCRKINSISTIQVFHIFNLILSVKCYSTKASKPHLHYVGFLGFHRDTELHGPYNVTTNIKTTSRIQVIHTHTFSKPLILLGRGGCWSLSQWSLGRRQETPWRGRQFITGQTLSGYSMN